MKPPTKAPAMPIKMVTMMPPGSGPGMIHFASTPAINPTTINAKIPMRFHLPPRELLSQSGVSDGNIQQTPYLRLRPAW